MLELNATICVLGESVHFEAFWELRREIDFIIAQLINAAEAIHTQWTRVMVIWWLHFMF